MYVFLCVCVCVYVPCGGTIRPQARSYPHENMTTLSVIPATISIITTTINGINFARRHRRRRSFSIYNQFWTTTHCHKGLLSISNQVAIVVVVIVVSIVLEMNLNHLTRK